MGKESGSTTLNNDIESSVHNLAHANNAQK